MNPLIADCLDNADLFSTVVTSAGPTADWSAPSPCPDWAAADVVDHVVDTQRDFLVKRGADLGQRPEGAPEDVWQRHRDAVTKLVADEDFVTEEYDGYFGRTTIAETLANFYGFDMAVHRWDLGRALGVEVTFAEDEMDGMETAIAGFGDALYSEGVCGPPVDVPEDAPRQTKVLGLLGRTA